MRGSLALADMGIRERMLVKDVMSSPVITVNEDETVEKVAQLMDKYRPVSYTHLTLPTKA